MEKHPDTELINQIERFLAYSGMRRTTFGRQAVGDQNLLAQLKTGRDLRKSTRDRILMFIGSYPLVEPDCSCLRNNNGISEAINQPPENTYAEGKR